MAGYLQRGALRNFAIAQPVKAPQFSALLSRRSVHHQSVLQPSFWKSLIPKPFRPRPKPTVDWGPTKKLKRKPKGWNPATFFIVIFILIGSMGINMISLKQSYNTFMRRADVRIGVLREVVEKLQRGEDVDVGKALGTGDAEKEAEWEEVLREIERDDTIKNAKKAAKSGSAPSTPAAKESTPESTPTQNSEPIKSKKGHSNFF
ncbi:hypothetical protein F4777DRAFT_364257 [Nemania sp. FL0916]|nr:hypothetical protein F4777DRAFT_364257 [Nemania sp. FL0916]